MDTAESPSKSEGEVAQTSPTKINLVGCQPCSNKTKTIVSAEALEACARDSLGKSAQVTLGEDQQLLIETSLSEQRVINDVGIWNIPVTHSSPCERDFVN